MTQPEALLKMLSGANVFLTGEPGAGKTYTLNLFIEEARMQGKEIAITASTGIAASHIDGQTIHSWSGLGIAETLSDNDIKRLMTKPFIKRKYQNADILIIDEVSMLHGYRLDMIERMCRAMRSNDEPFGGLQVVLVGDMFQLPPVVRGEVALDQAVFAHQSEAWQKANLCVCYLTEQHRQGADDELLDILRAMRSDTLTDEHIDKLKSRVGHEANDDMTRLYTHNIDVDALNQTRLDQLTTEPKVFKMTESGNEYRIQALKKNVLAPEYLRLKVGAEVMFVANNPKQGFVNGTRGKVTEFRHGAPVVITTDDKEIEVDRHTWSAYDDLGRFVVAEVSQYPLRLAWAVTVHKSQGMSLDEAEIDLDKAFTPGMGYVALSRVRSLQGLYLSGIGGRALEMDPEIREFDKKLKERSNNGGY